MVSISLNPSMMRFSTNIHSKPKFLNLFALILMMCFKGLIQLFSLMDKLAQERLLPCSDLIGMIILDIRILFKAWDPASIPSTEMTTHSYRISKSLVLFRDLFSTSSRDSTISKWPKEVLSQSTVHFCRSTTKNCLIYFRIEIMASL